MFHFQIVHVEGKKNVVADALSRKPQISAVSIPYHHELDDMREQYANDEDFARVFEQLMDGQRHEHYLLKDGFMMMHGRLCVTRPLRRKVMEESHVPPYGEHCGIDATVKAVETFFYWPALRRDVDAFVRECIICHKVKFDRQKAPGLLQPLPIPDKPWESIAMDFIFDLSRTQTGNDGIWTIICRFSKQAHFIPVRKKIKPDQMARLFMSNIFKYHGMPQSIVSDRDRRMTSLFWRGLFENMGTTLKFSSSFHPQTDGQSEEANSNVLDLLKCYVSEHKGKWEQYLPLVEYAYNNTVHSSIGKAPFEIVEGGKKVPPILHTKDKTFEADKYVQDMDEMYKKVKVALEKTQAKQKKAADSHRREVVFSLGDWVLLRFEKARLKKMKGKESLFPKLSMRYYGLFKYWTTASLEGSPYYGLTSNGSYPAQARPPIFSKLSLRQYRKLLSRVLLPWKLLPRHGTIAADTDFYPFGTRMFVPGYGWGEVEDRGSAIKGPKRIDLYHRSHNDALVWGRRKLTVLVVLPGQSTIDGLPIPGALKGFLKGLDWIRHLLF
ncbi:hypothetical protein L7F22_052327 [Adiantum nelumboides]|nr:hypothetical protein [Adiantum nelumboides]